MFADAEGMLFIHEYPNPQMNDLISLDEARAKLRRALMYPSEVKFTADGDLERFAPVCLVLGERLTTNEVKALVEGITSYSCAALYMERVYPGGTRVAQGNPIGYLYLVHLADRKSGVPVILNDDRTS